MKFVKFFSSAVLITMCSACSSTVYISDEQDAMSTMDNQSDILPEGTKKSAMLCSTNNTNQDGNITIKINNDESLIFTMELISDESTYETRDSMEVYFSNIEDDLMDMETVTTQESIIVTVAHRNFNGASVCFKKAMEELLGASEGEFADVTELIEYITGNQDSLNMACEGL